MYGTFNRVYRVWQLGGFFFSAALTAQNSPEFHFRFIDYFIQPSRVGSLIPAFPDSQTGLNRKLKQGSVAWCSSKGGQSAVQRWACSFRVRQAARTDHRIGDTELRRAGGRSENLGVHAYRISLINVLP